MKEMFCVEMIPCFVEFSFFTRIENRLARAFRKARLSISSAILVGEVAHQEFCRSYLYSHAIVNQPRL
jgi:hypothetical protein